MLSFLNIAGLFAAGAFGALAKDCVADGKLKLPKVVDGELALGFLSGMLIGAFVGWAIDGSFLTAGLAGYVGISAVTSILPVKKQA